MAEVVPSPLSLPLFWGLDFSAALAPLLTVVGLLVGVLLLWGWLRRKTWRSRETDVLIPDGGYKDGATDIQQRGLTIASALVRKHTGPLTNSVDTMRLTFRPDDRGRLVTLVEAPRHAMATLRGIWTAAAGVTIRTLAAVALPADPLARPAGLDAALVALDADRERWLPVPVAEGAGGDVEGAGAVEEERDEPSNAELVESEPQSPAGYTAGANKVLAAAPRKPRRVRRDEMVTVAAEMVVRGGTLATLNTTGTLDPSLLAGIAESCRGLNVARGEDLAVDVWLRPLTDGERRGYRRMVRNEIKALTTPTTKATQGDGWFAAFGGSGKSAKTTTMSAPTFGADIIQQQKAEARRALASTHALWYVRVRIYVRRPEHAAVATMNMLRSALAPLNGPDARWETRGIGLGFGDFRPFFLGANFPGVLKLMLLRTRQGLVPRAKSVTTTAELGPLTAPPTDAVDSDAVRRQAELPVVPRNLPVYDPEAPDPGIAPVGASHDHDGNPIVLGQPLKMLEMGAMFARTGNGKSATVINLLEHIWRNTSSGFFCMDPEGTMYDTFSRFAGSVDRPLVNIDFNKESQTNFNPLDMSRRPRAEADDVIDGVVGAIQGALKWGDSANRALTILTVTLRTLLHLNSYLVEKERPDLQATLFTVPMLLTENSEFRSKLYGILPNDITDYWKNTFGSLERSAVPVVTNLMNRLRGDYSPLGAFLGQPVSSFDFRSQLAQGGGTFLTAHTDGANDRLMSFLLLHHFFREARRRDPRGTDYPHCYAVLDELLKYDSADGFLAEFLNLLRKRHVSIMGLLQAFSLASQPVQASMKANLTTLAVGPYDTDERKPLAQLLHVDPLAVGDLDTYEWLMRFRAQPGSTQPYIGPVKVKGIPPEVLWAKYHDAGNPAQLAEKMREQFRMTTRAAVMKDMNTHDARLAEFVMNQRFDVPDSSQPSTTSGNSRFAPA